MTPELDDPDPTVALSDPRRNRSTVSEQPPAETESISVERRSPEETFELIANEVRVEILDALGENPNGALSFSELYDRVEIDDTGNFNYHLKKLCGSFVRHADGYELTYAGRRIVGAIHAGTYTANATVEPTEIGWDCQLCGGEMVVGYRDERARFRCLDCERGAEFPFPPGALDQFARSELPHAFSRWWYRTVTEITSGFCPTCSGRLDGELARLPGGDEAEPAPSMVAFECCRCGTIPTVSGATVATVHPAVEGFLDAHGFDVSTRHPSQIWDELDASSATVVSEDPSRIEFRFEHGDEAVAVELEPDGTVGAVSRHVSDA